MQLRTPVAPHPAASEAPANAPASKPRVPWNALVAGAAVAAAVGTALAFLGVAVEATAVEAATGDAPAAAGSGIGAAVWLLASGLLGLAAGGYAAARLCGSD